MEKPPRRVTLDMRHIQAARRMMQKLISPRLWLRWRFGFFLDEEGFITDPEDGQRYWFALKPEHILEMARSDSEQLRRLAMEIATKCARPTYAREGRE